MRLRLRGLNQKKKEKKINLHSTTLRRFATKITRTKTQKHSPSLAFPPFSRPGLGPAAPDFGPTVARASEEPATSPTRAFLPLINSLQTPSRPSLRAPLSRPFSVSFPPTHSSDRHRFPALFPSRPPLGPRSLLLSSPCWPVC